MSTARGTRAEEAEEGLGGQGGGSLGVGRIQAEAEVIRGARRFGLSGFHGLEFSRGPTVCTSRLMHRS